MSVKVFQTNSNGKIEFTRAELEKLLNDTYKEGHRDGENKANNSYWTWVSPTLANSPAITYTNTNTNTGAIRTTPDSITVTCADVKVNEDALNKLAGMESKSTAAPKITANVSVNGAKGQVYDLSSLAKEIDQILFGIPTPTPAGSCGTFAAPKNEHNANLAKELRNV